MSSPPRRTSYHHGHLVETLIAEAIALIEAEGVEALSVRAVARRAGVSPAAPFRHFPSKTALLTAVAVQAMARLRERIDHVLADGGDRTPLAALEAVGMAYLDWAGDNPTHFLIISSRTLIDFDGTPELVGSNRYLRGRMTDLIRQAITDGELTPDIDVDRLVLGLRAFAYGLARMRCDGHMPEWHPAEPPDTAARAALRQYIGLLARKARI